MNGVCPLFKPSERTTFWRTFPRKRHIFRKFFCKFGINAYICTKNKIMLDREFKYYLDHQSELLPLYDGKYVMIVGDKVVGAFNSIGEAYYNGKDRVGLGNFLVQLCTPGDNAYTVTYRSRVSF